MFASIVNDRCHVVGTPCVWAVCDLCAAEGMAHLKSQQIAHRDIKPGNIMRCREVDGSWVQYMEIAYTGRRDKGEESWNMFLCDNDKKTNSIGGWTW